VFGDKEISMFVSKFVLRIVVTTTSLMMVASTAVGASRVSAQSEIQGPFVGEPVYPAVVNIDLRNLPQATHTLLQPYTSAA